MPDDIDKLIARLRDPERYVDAVDEVAAALETLKEERDEARANAERCLDIARDAEGGREDLLGRLAALRAEVEAQDAECERLRIDKEWLSAQVDATSVLSRVVAELRRAMGLFGPFASDHEGWAVLREEVDELWEEVKANRTQRAREEAIQVAAMGLRFVIDSETRAALDAEGE